MSTIATTSDTTAASGAQTSGSPAEDGGKPPTVTTASRRGLLDRITKAVRAAHAASVPF